MWQNGLGIILLGHLLLAGFVCAAPPADQPAAEASPFERWEKSIAAFEAEDKQNPPPRGGVLFVGSSSIRLWDLKKSFPKHAAINRGFGGSEIADSVHFAHRIVLKHKPNTVVFYAGDNDIAKMKSPQQVAADFSSFVKTVHQKLPKTKIIYIAIKPSIARWKLTATMQRANKLIQTQCKKDERLVFVDVYPPMLGDAGQPRPELFAKDGLHLNAEGYKLWTSLIEPHLPAPTAAKSQE